MGLNRGVGAFQFNGRFGSGNRVDGGPEHVGLSVLVNVALVLLHFDELRRPGQSPAETRRNPGAGAVRGRLRAAGRLRALSLVRFPYRAARPRDGGSGGTIFFELLGGRPVDHSERKFFPLVALGTEVADPVAFDFIFGDQLVRAVVEDDAAGGFLGEGRKRRQQGRDQQPSGTANARIQRHTYSSLSSSARRESNQVRKRWRPNFTAKDTKCTKEVRETRPSVRSRVVHGGGARAGCATRWGTHPGPRGEEPRALVVCCFREGTALR